jgi:hypothetical protein
MAIITPPVPLPLRGVQWRRKRAQQVNRSEWTRTRQLVRLPKAAQWTASGEFIPVRQQANALQWQGFFAQLDGMANAFPLVAVEAAQLPVGCYAQVNGAGQVGASLSLFALNTTGNFPTGTTFLPTGSMITVPLPDGTVQMDRLTAPLIAGAGGVGTATLESWLRKSPTDGAVVEVRLPYALLTLDQPEDGWDVAQLQDYGFAFSAEELI